MSDDCDLLSFNSRTEWRSWLEAHHDRAIAAWIVIYKNGPRKAWLSLHAAQEEALCFGWVDSIIQKINDEKYARKFNPRRAGSFWSASNKKRMEKLITEGRMTRAGLAKYDPDARESTSENGQRIRRGEIPIPVEVMQRVESNPRAWENFQRLPPSHQRQYMSWVLSAKKVETQQKRLDEVIAVLEQGKRLGLK